MPAYTQTYVVPSDCNYIAVLKEMNSVSYAHYQMIVYASGETTSNYTKTLSDSVEIGVDPVTIAGFTRSGGALVFNCTYGAQIRISNYGSAASYWHHITLQLTDGTNTITIYDSPNINKRVGQYEYYTVDTLASPSEAMQNLTGTTPLSLIVKLQTWDNNWRVIRGGKRVPSGETMVVQCTGGGGVAPNLQACSVYYIP